ncbi:MAG: hypothetical protein V1777_03845 [Candidatus Micrarchaeota archaeon]
MKTPFLVLASFFFLTSISASILPTNCTAFQGEQYTDCQNILTDTSLTQLEKEDLYLNLVNIQGDLPSFDFAWNWNNQLTFNQAPETLPPTNNGIIKNAWLKIVGIKKSVFDENQQKWFTQNQGSILTAKNYEIENPVGPLLGECQTNYSYSITQNDFQIQANNQILGTTNQANYSFSLPNQNDLNFLADWQIAAQLKTDHYTLQEHSFFDGHQWHYWTECTYTNTTYNNYAIHLQDQLLE